MLPNAALPPFAYEEDCLLLKNCLARIAFSALDFDSRKGLFTAYQKLPDDADARPICSFAPVSGTYVTPIASNSVTRPLSSLS
ncbi:unnamed protein product [Bathycoccus prasinos]